MSKLNPLTALIGLFLITVPLLSKISTPGASISLIITIILGFCTKTSWIRVCKMLAGLILLIPVSSLSMLLYAQPEGHIYFSWSFATISSNSISLAIAVALRILALTLPIAIIAPRVDPILLGDAAGQVLHIPRRFVVGTVGGLRMLPLMKNDWQQLSRARRARGVGDQLWLRAFIEQAFSLLVLSLRRAHKLSRAMEVRGLLHAREEKQSTWARPSSLSRVDYIFLACSVLWGAIPTIIAWTV
ncbi:MAG: energy-coupling factor transporter transmembrane component T [Corynebacterium sp.]|nr:energy-coupling factor transporter transmembrane component T [Corynebacterium sp.]